VTEYLVGTSAAAWKIKEVLAAVGEEFATGEIREIYAANFLNKTCRAWLKIDTYEGRKKNVVDTWIPKYPPAPPVPLPVAGYPVSSPAATPPAPPIPAPVTQSVPIPVVGPVPAPIPAPPSAPTPTTPPHPTQPAK